MGNNTKIICVGNRFIKSDAAGPMVYDCLKGKKIPDGVDVIDGGLAGLNLLCFVEGSKRVIFVDSVEDIDMPDAVVTDKIFVFAACEMAEHLYAKSYDHSAGLSYLLRVLPEILKDEMPETLLVGINGEYDDCLIEEAARISLEMALKT